MKVSKLEINKQIYAKYFYNYVLSTNDYICIGDYVGSMKPIDILHKSCNKVFTTTPNRFKDLNKRCPHCHGNLATNNKAKLTFKDYMINKAKDYTLLSEYITSMKKVKIRHNTCGYIWDTTPNQFKDHKHRCPQCASNYSQASIKWLTELSNMLDITIQHAENYGEFNIPGTRYRVDGYCKEYNLIFEFHGDLFHGSLVEDKILSNPFTKENGEECFKRTLNRMKYLDNLDYSIFYVFECDYNNGHIGSFFNKHPWALT